MRLLLARAGEDLLAFDVRQVSRILPWPTGIEFPRGSLRALVGAPAAAPEPRALLSRAAANNAPFVLTVPVPLWEEDVSDQEVLPLPPLLLPPRWVRGLLQSAEAPALLLDLPSLGDLVLTTVAGASSPHAPESRT